MAQGKFSHPRPHREEDRQIERAFRQVTGQEPVSPPPDPLFREPDSQAFDLTSGERDPFAQNAPEQADLFGTASPPETDPFHGDFPEDPEPFHRDLPEDSKGSFSDSVMAFCGKALDFCDKNRKIVLLCVCALALVLIIGITAAFLISTADPYDGKILNNVFIANVNVGGLTKKEAISAVQNSAAQTYAKEDMVIDLAGTSLRLTASEVNATLNVKNAVNAAYDYGRTGSQAERDNAYLNSLTGSYSIDLTDYLQVDKRYIRDTLSAFSKDGGSTLTQASYGLEGEQPELAADEFDENAPCQTLVITMGTPGIGFDPDAVYQQVLEAYGLFVFQITVDQVDPVKAPDPVDLDAIYKEFYIAPVDASVDMKTYQVIPGSYGYGFDLEAARILVAQADFGEEVRIPMEYIQPEILEEDAVLFQDVLGEYQTSCTNNENRNTNLRLACQALNGLVLKPGETFSFNDTLGQRTAAKGYKPAPAYSGSDLVDTVGGGVCQVSSTLYYCTLLADLATVSRVNHGFPASYIDMGMDAAVSWSSPDFKFKNSSDFPIKLEAEVSGGYVKIRILGTDRRDYYIKLDYEITQTYEPETEYTYFEYDNAEGYQDGDVIQKGITGYSVKTYKLKYDKLTNRLISREYEASSRYNSQNKIVARVEPEPTEPPTESTAPETTPPETTAPPETTSPPESTMTPEPDPETPQSPEE